MSNFSSPKQSSSSLQNSFLAALGKADLDLQHAELIIQSVFETDSSSLPIFEEKFNSKIHKLIRSNKCPIFYTDSIKKDEDNVKVQKFMDILNIFHFVLEPEDAKILFADKNVHLNAIIKLIYSNLLHYNEKKSKYFNELFYIVKSHLTGYLNSFVVTQDSINQTSLTTIQTIFNIFCITERNEVKYRSYVHDFTQKLLAKHDELVNSKANLNYFNMLLYIANNISKYEPTKSFEYLIIIFDNIPKTNSSLFIELSSSIVNVLRKLDFQALSQQIFTIFYQISADFPITTANSLQICILSQEISTLLTKNKLLKQKHLNQLLTLLNRIIHADIGITKKMDCFMLISDKIFSKLNYQNNKIEKFYILENVLPCIMIICDEMTPYKFQNNTVFTEICSEFNNFSENLNFFKNFVFSLTNLLGNIIKTNTDNVNYKVTWNMKGFQLDLLKNTILKLLKRYNTICNDYTSFYKGITHLDHPKTDPQYYLYAAKNYDIKITAKTCLIDYNVTSNNIISFVSDSPDDFRSFLASEFLNYLIQSKTEISFAVEQILFNNCFVGYFFDTLIENFSKIEIFNQIISVLSPSMTEMKKYSSEHTMYCDKIKEVLLKIIENIQNTFQYKEIFNFLIDFIEYAIAAGCSAEEIISESFIGKLFNYSHITYPKSAEYLHFLEFCVTKNKEIVSVDSFVEKIIFFMPNNLEKCLEILKETSFSTDYFANRKFFMEMANILYHQLPICSIPTRTFIVQVIRTLTPKQFNDLSTIPMNIDEKVTFSLNNFGYSATTDTETFIVGLIESTMSKTTKFTNDLFQNVIIELFSHSLMNKRSKFISYILIDGLIKKMATQNFDISDIYTKILSKSIFVADLLFSVFSNNYDPQKLPVFQLFDTEEGISSVIFDLILLFEFYPYHNGYFALKIAEYLGYIINQRKFKCPPFIDFVNSHVIPFSSTNVPLKIKEDEIFKEIFCFDEKIQEIFRISREISFRSENNNNELKLLIAQESLENRLYLTYCINKETTNSEEIISDLLQEGKFETAGLLLRLYNNTNTNIDLNQFTKQQISSKSDSISYYISISNDLTGDFLENIMPIIENTITKGCPIKQIQSTILLNNLKNFDKISFVKSMIEPNNIDRNMILYRVDKYSVANQLIEEFNSLNFEKNQEKFVKNLTNVIINSDVTNYLSEIHTTNHLHKLIEICEVYNGFSENLTSFLNSNPLLSYEYFDNSLNEFDQCYKVYKLTENKIFKEKLQKILENLHKNFKEKIDEKSVMFLLIYTELKQDIYDHKDDTILRLIYPSILKVLIKKISIFSSKDLLQLLEFYHNKFFIGIYELVNLILEKSEPVFVDSMEQFISNNCSTNRYRANDIISFISNLKIQKTKLFLCFLAKSVYKYDIKKYIKHQFQDFPFFSIQTLIKNEMQDKAGGSFDRLFTSLHFYIDDNALTALSNSRIWNSYKTESLQKFLSVYYNFCYYPNIVLKLFEMIQEDKYETYHLDVFKEMILNQVLIIRSNENNLVFWYKIIMVLINLITKNFLNFDREFQANVAQHLAVSLSMMSNDFSKDFILFKDKNIFENISFFVDNTFKAMPLVDSLFDVCLKDLNDYKTNPLKTKYLLESLSYVTRFTSTKIPEEIIKFLKNLSLEEKSEIWPYGILALTGCLDADNGLLKVMIPKFYKKSLIYRIFPMLNLVSTKIGNKNLALANFAISFAKSFDVFSNFDTTYFLGIIFEIKSSEIFDLLKKELQNAKENIEKIESQNFIVTFFVAVFTSGIQNKYLKKLVNDYLNFPQIINLFRSNKSYAKFIFDHVKSPGQIKILQKIEIPGEINLSLNLIKESPEQYTEQTSIFAAMFSYKNNLKSFENLLRTDFGFKVKKNPQQKDFSIKIKIGFDNLSLENDLTVWPELQTAKIEYLSSKMTKISNLQLLNLMKTPKQDVDQKFLVKINKILTNIFNSTEDVKANVLKTVDNQVKFSGDMKEMFILTLICEEYKNALNGFQIFNYTIPPTFPIIYHLTLKTLRKLGSEVLDETLEINHEKQIEKSKFLFQNQLQKIQDDLTFEKVTPENLKNFILFNISLEGFNSSKVVQLLNAALRLSTSDILLSLLYKTQIPLNWNVPFDWSILFLNKRNNVGFISSAFYLAMPEDFVPTDHLPSIDKFKQFLTRISENPIIKQLSEADKTDFENSEKFKKSVLNGKKVTIKPLSISNDQVFATTCYFSNLRSPLVKENLNLINVVCSIKSPRENTISLDGRLSNGKSVHYLLSFRSNFNPSFYVFCQTISRILKKCPASSNRNMIISSCPFLSCQDFTLILTDGKPMISKTCMMKQQPAKVRKIQNIKTFTDTKEKCEWQRLLINRYAALSILQYVVTSPVINPLNIYIDFSSASLFVNDLKINGEKEEDFVFPKLTGHIRKYLGVFDGQMTIAMCSAAVSMMMFTPKIKVLAHSLMNFSVESTELIEAALDDIGNFSEENYSESYSRIQKLIQQGMNESIDYSIPWL
ncbi:hypothetical protein TVAG_476440 [Trichomonas vaginalis G3]|uniref:Uncharacterized protein n=1 Tax=Trichomonas vaginalis (strain ATCC PRA-98 / G3) TaxID=412133 RepID=A2DA67_TRIV3|nr:hypothetical protein TVAGG3_0266460 [Trichomonas vaginalis G3]EAY22715.1 hypothetical protein TVAG_476440 [Trichomonas vaginalis G3]KAI5525528.1 hypothetical protein TVAGG3_0266460 [Trichomonas vaginalis G3]|eukprot:XP_001583701.1 hypothetical protein [Trichomonas vaginalis G3]